MRDPLREGGQEWAYADALSRARGQTRWLAFIDLDEFLFSPGPAALPDVLREYEEHSGIVVNWQVYGSCGHTTAGEGLVIERFVRRARTRWVRNRRVKSIVDPERAMRTIGPHFFEYADGALAVTEGNEPVRVTERRAWTRRLRRSLVRLPLVETDPYAMRDSSVARVSVARVRLNHYAVRSRQEFEQKSSTGSQALSLPITQLSDGKHTLALVAVDAAGNQSNVASEEITVDNSAPPSPSGLSATATQPGGATFRVTWSDPQGQLAPITGALYQVCPASGSGSCSAPGAAPAAGPATVTVPGPGSWSIAVWLTNAAGNASPANAARTNVVVPSVKPGVSGSGQGGAGTTRKLRVTERLRGRKLIVHVTGPAKGMVRVGFTGKLKGRIVASAAKTAALKHGRLTVTFKLGPRTAVHALIRVTAKLDHGTTVMSTLRRLRPHRHR